MQDLELTGVLAEGGEYDFHISRESLMSMLKKTTNLLILLFNVVLYVASGSITFYFIRMMVIDHAFTSSIAVLFFLLVYSAQIVGVLFWTRRADKKSATSKKGKSKS